MRPSGVRPCRSADLDAVPSSPLIDILRRAGVRAVLAVPLLHQDEVIGALIVRRNQPGAFSPEIVRLIEAFAAQSAIAVHNARLFHEIEEKGRQLEIASQHKSQFVANMSHELRTPLAAMLGYAELLQEEHLRRAAGKGDADPRARSSPTASTSRADQHRARHLQDRVRPVQAEPRRICAEQHGRDGEGRDRVARRGEEARASRPRSPRACPTASATSSA